MRKPVRKAESSKLILQNENMNLKKVNKWN